MSKKKKSEPIVGEKPREVEVRFLVRGQTELLQHNCEGALSRGPAGQAPKTIPTAKEEAERGTYRMKNGQLYIKPDAFQGSMINARGGCSGRKIGKSTANSRVVAGVDFLLDTECPLFNPKTKKPIHTYVIDERPVVIKQSGRVLRARPKIAEWACYLHIKVDERYITLPMLQDLFNVSGKVAGVGDFRPQCKGRFGKYQVEIVPDSIVVLETFGEVTEETEQESDDA
jgi:hypothetical protein